MHDIPSNPFHQSFPRPVDLVRPIVSSRSAALQVLMSGRFDGFMVLAMLWAAVNAIPPVLFIVYFFTKGSLLRWSCTLGQALGLLLGAGGDRMHGAL